MPASAMGLMDAVDAAIRNDATFAAAQADARAVRQNEKMARAAFMPQVVASLSEGRSHFDREFQSAGALRTDKTDQSTRSNTLQLRQVLFNLDTLARYRQSQVQTAAADEGLRKERQDLFVRVASAYMDVLSASDLRQLAQAESSASAEIAANLETAFKRGEAASTDAAEARARADVAAVRVIEAGEQMESAVRVLEAQVGVRVTELSGLNKSFNWQGVVRDEFEAWRLLALDNNPEIRMSEQTVNFYQQELKKQQAGHYPRVDLVLSKTQAKSDTVNTIGIKSDIDALAVQVQVPLFSGFSVTHAVEQAIARLEKARFEQDATVRRVGTDLFKSYTAARLASSKLAALDKASLSAQESVKAAQLGIKTGLRVTADLLSARQKQYQSRVEFAKAFYESALALLKLRAGAGLLTEEDLRGVATVFAENATPVRF
jgi:protease secretion system outer membrane protein